MPRTNVVGTTAPPGSGAQRCAQAGEREHCSIGPWGSATSSAGVATSSASTCAGAPASPRIGGSMKLQRAGFSLSGSGGFGSSQKGALRARSAPRGYSFPSKVADLRKFSRGERRRRPEAQLHAAVVEHLRLRAEPDVLWLHCPNGERRDKITGAKLKRMGVVPGTADLLFWHRGNSYALELKSLGGRLSDAQLEFLARFNDAGGHSTVAEGLDRAIAVLEAWGLLRGRVS
jgi:hypothetical protein